MPIEYEGFELEWADDVMMRFDEERKSLRRADPSEAAPEADEVTKALSSRWRPRRLQDGGFPKIEVSTGRASALIIVLPPRHRLLATEAARDVDFCLEWAEGIKGYPLLVYYSRKGLMTTAAYLYLGNVMEDNRIGILFVNGPPAEVTEVLDILERKGEYMPDEEVRVVDFNF